MKFDAVIRSIHSTIGGLFGEVQIAASAKAAAGRVGQLVAASGPLLGKSIREMSANPNAPRLSNRLEALILALLSLPISRPYLGTVELPPSCI